MAKQQTLSTGIKINVDTTDFDVKFAKTAAELNKSLSKSQKALGLFYNEQGLLVNSQGQLVEGLSQAQVKLGQYVDELGRTRTYQGGFTEGLNASQKAMGWFSDELGNVYNRLGELVVESKRAADGLDDVADSVEASEKALKEVGDAVDDSIGAMGRLGSQTAQVFATLQAAGGASDEFSRSMIAAGEGIAVFSDTYDVVNSLTFALRSAATAQQGLNAVIAANPLGLLAGVATAIATYKAQAKDMAAEWVGLFQEVEAAAKRAGRSIENAFNVSQIGILGTPGLGQDYSSAFEKMETSQIQFDRAVGAKVNAGSWWDVVKAQANIFSPDDEKNTWSALGGSLQKEASENLETARKQYNQNANAFLQLQQQMIATARDAVLLESQKLEAEKANYQAMLVDAQGTQEEATIRAYILELDKKIAEAKKSELAEYAKNYNSERGDQLDWGTLENEVRSGRMSMSQAQATYADALSRSARSLDIFTMNQEVAAGRLTMEQAKSARETYLSKERDFLTGLGVDEIRAALEPPKSELDKLAEKASELNAAFQNGLVSQDSFNSTLVLFEKQRTALQKVEDDAKKIADDNKKAELRAKYGVDAALASLNQEIEAAKTPFELMQSAIAGYGVALQKGAIDTVTYNRLTAHERDKYLKATKDAADAAEQERRSKIAALRSESGIDSLLDSLKSPWQKYLEKLDEINGYVAEGAVTAAEAQLLADKALDDAAANAENDFKLLDAAKEAQAKTVDAATAGSAELYKMQVTQANDQAAKMLEAQRQLLASSQQMALYMFRMQENIAAIAANWPKVYGR